MTSPATTVVDRRGGFAHAAVCHDSYWELSEAVLPFIEEGIARSERVFVNMAATRMQMLKAELGRDADRVQWSDTRRWHPHPARRLRGILDLVDGEQRHGAGHLRFVGECPWPDEPPEMVQEWERFDAVLNEALVGASLAMVCAYDATALPAGVVERAAETHPLLGARPAVPSPAYMGPERFLRARQSPDLPLPEGARRIGSRVTPAEAREHVRQVLANSRPLPVTALDDLIVAVTEVVTNAWLVGAGSIEVACWRFGAEVGVQVDDDGPGIEDALAGYRQPSPGADSGRGLWITRQMADLVQIATGPSGTRVRLRMFDRGWQTRG